MTPENVGQQFMTLYRGIASKGSVKEIRFEGLGRHWTPDREVAESFAVSSANDPVDPTHPHAWQGFIVRADVPTEHIVDPESDEGKELASKHKIFGREHGEEEHTVREGAPLNISGVEKVNLTMAQQSRSKEMKRFPRTATA